MKTFISKSGKKASESGEDFNYASPNIRKRSKIKNSVSSKKEKFYSELHCIIHLMWNMMVSNDFPSLSSKFAELTKCHARAQNWLGNKEMYPEFFINFLDGLLKYVEDFWNDKDRKKLKKHSYKAMSTLRNKLHKFCRNHKGEKKFCLKNFVDRNGFKTPNNSTEYSHAEMVSDNQSPSERSLGPNARSRNLGKDTKIKFGEIFSLLKRYVYLQPNHENKIAYWKISASYAYHLTSMLVQSSKRISISLFHEEEELFTEPFKVCGSLSKMITQLVGEFHIILKEMDPFTPMYNYFLNYEAVLLEIIKNALKLKNCYHEWEVCDIYWCKIELVYHKIDGILFEENPYLYMYNEYDLHFEAIYNFYARDNHEENNRRISHVLLCHVYHKAINDQWFGALKMMEKFTSVCTMAETARFHRIDYNRALAQLGLCAFRLGYIDAAHDNLSLLTDPWYEILLGQNEQSNVRNGVYKVLYHKHIDVKLLDYAKAITCMFLGKKIPSLLKWGDDHITELLKNAAKALNESNWIQCSGILFGLKMNSEVWRRIRQPTPLYINMEREIRKCSLKKFIKNYKPCKQLSLYELSAKFRLNKTRVICIIIEMVEKAEISGTFDIDTFELRENGTYLQTLRFQLPERLEKVAKKTESKH